MIAFQEWYQKDPFQSYRHMELEDIVVLKKKERYFVSFYNQQTQRHMNFILNFPLNTVKEYHALGNRWGKVTDGLICVYILMRVQTALEEKTIGTKIRKFISVRKEMHEIG